MTIKTCENTQEYFDKDKELGGETLPINSLDIEMKLLSSGTYLKIKVAGNVDDRMLYKLNDGSEFKLLIGMRHMSELHIDTIRELDDTVINWFYPLGKDFLLLDHTVLSGHKTVNDKMCCNSI